MKQIVGGDFGFYGRRDENARRDKLGWFVNSNLDAVELAWLFDYQELLKSKSTDYI